MIHDERKCLGVTTSTYSSQGIYLFSVMAESTALQKLSLDGNDLSMVPPEHVAKGTNRLQEVIFRSLKGDIFLMLILTLMPIFRWTCVLLS